MNTTTDREALLRKMREGRFWHKPPKPDYRPLFIPKENPYSAKPSWWRRYSGLLVCLAFIAVWWWRNR